MRAWAEGAQTACPGPGPFVEEEMCSAAQWQAGGLGASVRRCWKLELARVRVREGCEAAHPGNQCGWVPVCDCAMHAGQAISQVILHPATRREFILKAFAAPAAFHAEAAVYADEAHPLRRFLPEARAIIRNADGAFVDVRGTKMPPCIVMLKGLSMQRWLKMPDVTTEQMHKVRSAVLRWRALWRPRGPGRHVLSSRPRVCAAGTCVFLLPGPFIAFCQIARCSSAASAGRPRGGSLSCKDTSACRPHACSTGSRATAGVAHAEPLWGSAAPDQQVRAPVDTALSS